MAIGIANEFRKYFAALTSTSAIVTAFGGVTFTAGSNLFVGEEKESHVNMLTIYPTGGTPPAHDRQKYESSVQIRLKTTSNAIGLNTMQEIINTMHQNENVCASANGRVFSLQSNPLVIGKIEGGKFSIFTSNYNIKHIKL